MRCCILILLLCLVSTLGTTEEAAEPAPGELSIPGQTALPAEEPASEQSTEGGIVYKWKDGEGNTHYGDEPPEGIDAERVPMNAQRISVKKAEQIYTWTDPEGNVHYGDRPPEDSQAEQVDTESGSMSTIRNTVVRPGERQLLREIER